MNRTKEAERARTYTFISFLLFVFAALSSLIPDWGLYLALALVLFGGFSMIIGKMIKDRSASRVQSKVLEEENFV
ncbi:MAG: hypothetical protein ACYC7D_09255 [Nitrososphaerales archaeon]